MINTNTPKLSVTETNASQEENMRLMDGFRKENARLQNVIAEQQNLIATNQVAYESEINKILAEQSKQIAKSIAINFVSPNHNNPPES